MAQDKIIGPSPELRRALRGSDYKPTVLNKPIAGPGHGGVGTLSEGQRAAYAANQKHLADANKAVATADRDAKRANDAARAARGVNERSPYSPK